MKKMLALLLALVMTAALAACSGGQAGGSSGTDDSGAAEVTEAPALKVADDTAVMKMSFPVPEGFESVERFIDLQADGTVVEKNITYNFSDDEKLVYAFSIEEEDMTAMIEEEEHDTAEYAGKTFYILNYSGAYQAVSQEESDVFGVEYTPPEGGGREKFDEALSALSFTENTETVKDDTELKDAHYTIDESLPLWGWSTTVTETPSGELIKKSVVYKFGEDRDDLDFRFLVRLHKNTTIDSLKKDGKEYEEQEINGITYTVLVDSGEDTPYEYMTQQGEDVYVLRNNGANNGWWTSRSDESKAAFETFLGTFSFG